ncbi:MAG: hypothetical protein JW910_05345, partial [Anaerolineae bacterium]|nr:hypothetical protein [Anaerolineae bacterium]
MTIVDTVVVELRADTHQFSTGLQSAEREMGQFSRSMSGAIGGGLSGLGEKVTGLAQGFFYVGNSAKIAADAITGVGRQAVALAEVGAEARRAQLSLERMVGGPEQAAAWISGVKDATKGTVTEMEAAQLSFQALRLGMADTSEEASDFVRIAAIVGAASPQLGGAADAMTEISMTIANMSWRRLDQLGLSVAQVKARMEELRQANSGLSTEEA